MREICDLINLLKPSKYYFKEDNLISFFDISAPLGYGPPGLSPAFLLFTDTRETAGQRCHDGFLYEATTDPLKACSSL